MSKGTITTEKVPQEYQLLGGRNLTSRITYDEVPATCEPLGPYNKLIMCPGLLGGSPMSSSSRLSIGGKSPLTGGIKESNSGGTSAFHLARMGIKAVIVEGQCKQEQPLYLYLSKDKVELRPADAKYKGVYHSAQLFQLRYGNKVSVINIGPAGDREFLSAGIATTDPEGRPSRFCARGGLGAVMGSKGLKGVIIDPEGAPGLSYNDEKAFKDKTKELIKLLRESPATGEGYPKYGTPAMAARTNALNGLPTRNFTQGTFECVEYLHGEFMYDLIQKRNGEGTPTHSCMPGCMIRCSSVYPDASGKELVSPLEYETIGLMGSNCGIGNLEDIAQLNYICNDLGVDTIEIGAALGIAMEMGVIPFGDAHAAENLLEEIRNNTVLGKVLAQGCLITGKVLGCKRIPTVKGQAMAAYEPRAIKGFGVTYATTPMGADHTAGSTIRAQVSHTDPKPQPEASRKAQLVSGIADFTGMCMFSLPVLGAQLEDLAKLVNFRYGKDLNADSLLEMSAEMIRTERAFNRKAGIGSAYDQLPEYMTDEPLPGINEVFDVNKEEMKKLHD